MSDSTTPTPAAPAPGSDPGAAPAADAPVVPEGYVPVAQVEAAREEARRRYQSELDRTKADLARLQSVQSAPAGGEPSGGVEGFDPDAFRRQLLSDVYAATSMSSAAEKVRAEFPHADPGLFTPEGLSRFTNADSLRYAAEDSHKRVAAILDAERAAIEAKVREEFAATHGGGAGPATPPATPGGDPTPAQLAAMSVDELNAYEAAHPGVVERVLAKVGA